MTQNQTSETFAATHICEIWMPVFSEWIESGRGSEREMVALDAEERRHGMQSRIVAVED